MNNPRTASLYIADHTGANVFHAYQINHGPEWHYSTAGYSGVIVVLNEANLARAIAGVVHRLEYGWSFHAQWYIREEGDSRLHNKVYDCYPDQMGGVIADDVYLGWSEWIREAIPKTSAAQLDSSVFT